MIQAYDLKYAEHIAALRYKRDCKRALARNTLCQLDDLETPVARTRRYNNQILMDHLVDVKKVQASDSYDWVLVESGRALADCGSMTRKLVACPDDHHSRAIKISCHRVICPECGPGELKMRAEAALERLQGFGAAVRRIVRSGGLAYNLKHFKYVHMMISPPKSTYDKFYSKNGYKNICRTLGAYLRKLGVLGAIVMTHQYRDDDEGRLDTSEDSWHFHIVGVMPYGHLVNSDDFEARTGWVYKNLGQRKSLKDTIYYQMSHASITEYPIIREHEIVIQHGHILRWFGNSSYNNLSCIEDLDKRMSKHENCPDCGKMMHEKWFSDAIKAYVDQGLYIETIKFWIYFFSEPQLARLIKRFNQYKAKFVKKMGYVLAE
jgi:hypothetical protein